MIQILPNRTTTEANLIAINEPIDRISARTVANIHDLNESFDKFWKLPDEQINEILAYHGAETIQAIFGAHNVNGAAFNALLESRGIAAPRAILTAPRQLTVVDGGLIVEPMLEQVAEELMI